MSIKYSRTGINAKCLALSASRRTLNSCIAHLTSTTPDFLKTALHSRLTKQKQCQVFRDHLVTCATFQTVSWFVVEKNQYIRMQYLIIGFLNGLVEIWSVEEPVELSEQYSESKASDFKHANTLQDQLKYKDATANSSPPNFPKLTKVLSIKTYLKLSPYIILLDDLPSVSSDIPAFSSLSLSVNKSLTSSYRRVAICPVQLTQSSLQEAKGPQTYSSYGQEYNPSSPSSNYDPAFSSFGLYNNTSNQVWQNSYSNTNNEGHVNIVHVYGVPIVSLNDDKNSTKPQSSVEPVDTAKRSWDSDARSRFECSHILQQPYLIVGLQTSSCRTETGYLGTLIVLTTAQIRVYDSQDFELRLSISRFQKTVIPAFWQWLILNEQEPLTYQAKEKRLGPVTAVGSRWLVYQKDPMIEKQHIRLAHTHSATQSERLKHSEENVRSTSIYLNSSSNDCGLQSHLHRSMCVPQAKYHQNLDYRDDEVHKFCSPCRNDPELNHYEDDCSFHTHLDNMSHTNVDYGEDSMCPRCYPNKNEKTPDLVGHDYLNYNSRREYCDKLKYGSVPLDVKGKHSHSWFQRFFRKQNTNLNHCHTLADCSPSSVNSSTMYNLTEPISKLINAVPEAFRAATYYAYQNRKAASELIMPKTYEGLPAVTGGPLVIVDLLTGKELGTVQVQHQSSYYEAASHYSNQLNGSGSTHEPYINKSDLGVHKNLHCISVDDGSWCLSHVEQPFDLKAQSLDCNTRVPITASHSHFNSISSPVEDMHKFINLEQLASFIGPLPMISDSYTEGLVLPKSFSYTPVMSALFFDQTEITLFCVEWTGRTVFVCRFFAQQTSSLTQVELAETIPPTIKGYTCFELKRGETTGEIVHVAASPTISGNGCIMVVSSRGRCHCFSIPSLFQLSVLKHPVVSKCLKQNNFGEDMTILFPTSLYKFYHQFVTENEQKINSQEISISNSGEYSDKCDHLPSRHLKTGTSRICLSSHNHDSRLFNSSYFRTSDPYLIAPIGRYSLTLLSTRGISLDWKIAFISVFRQQCDKLNNTNSCDDSPFSGTQHAWVILTISSDGVLEFWCPQNEKKNGESEVLVCDDFSKCITGDHMNQLTYSHHSRSHFGTQRTIDNNLQKIKLQRYFIVSIRDLQSFVTHLQSKTLNSGPFLLETTINSKSPSRETIHWSRYCEPLSCALPSIRDKMKFHTVQLDNSYKYTIKADALHEKIASKAMSLNGFLRNGESFLKKPLSMKQFYPRTSDTELTHKHCKTAVYQKLFQAMDSVIGQPLNPSIKLKESIQSTVISPPNKLDWNTEEYVQYQYS